LIRSFFNTHTHTRARARACAHTGSVKSHFQIITFSIYATKFFPEK